MTTQMYRLIAHASLLFGLLIAGSAHADEIRKPYQLELDAGQRLVNAMSINVGDTRAGVLPYRNQEGDQRYGLGYRKTVGNTSYDTLLDKRGLVFAVDKSNRQFNVNLNTHEPETNNRTTYVQFSVVSYW